MAIDLINNLTLTSTFLFLGNLLLNKIRNKFENRKRLFISLAGITYGLFGLVLILWGFHLPESHILIDLRALAVIGAVYTVGSVAGLIAALIIISGRVLFFEYGNIDVLVVGASIVMIAWILSSFLLKGDYRVSLSRWLIIICCSMILPSILFYFTLQTRIFWQFITILIVFLVGGLFTYIILVYLTRSNHLFVLLKELANRDHLTGLHNPRAFEALFEETLNYAKSHQKNMSLLMLDIDHFKAINDTYGHSSGDAVLSQIGELLQDFVRSGDVCARKGGEEFIIILNSCTRDHAIHIAEKLRVLIEQNEFVLPNNRLLAITVSIGVATFPDTKSNLMLDKVDEALYEAKHQGRNRIYAV
ncbi:diguanylate cyclase [Paenibacillus sp. SORGH_AS306]|uniref:GGDEF domain-containing protein n=1 Tax=unclassified Paenibacillus TaxID=185978 RepID=UPI002782EDA6|nr:MULTISPECIES: GGDEF domain-containing protein [unclassified Paenibacillus]MDQ1236982.1 diguanylate cyclase [Paenibacillus sp. SORGH_AS_0306]MDR6109343.1 diguanylate cyclase [Paenibacillus sp. SORGH_AS_0338]